MSQTSHKNQAIQNQNYHLKKPIIKLHNMKILLITKFTLTVILQVQATMHS